MTVRSTVVRQQVSPNLFVNHLWRLATQDVHLHGRLNHADIDLAAPPPFKQIADLIPVDRSVENRGHDFELLDAVVFVAGVHGYLPHDELLGVGPVLRSRHSVRFVGALPNEGFIAMRSTGGWGYTF